MTRELFYDWPEWLLGLAAVMLFLLTAEAGFRLGRRARADDTDRSQVGTVVGAILGLLGLLLGFTFSMALSRFEYRTSLVVREANALGTAHLRARTLPEPQRAEIPRLLRQYVDVRLSGVGGAPQEPPAEVVRRSEEIQDRLWDQAVAAAAQSPSPVTALFVESLNEVIDVHGLRLAANRNHVPEVVLVLLVLAGCAAVGVFGYGGGQADRRTAPLTVTLAALIGLVLVVILDLDRPRRGLITVSQGSLLNLRESMGKLAP